MAARFRFHSSRMTLLQTITDYYRTHERFLAPAAFLAGFVFDNLTLTRIDLPRNYLLLLGYLVVAAACVALINIYGREPRDAGYSENLTTAWLPFILQFSFGGLFSGFVVYYVRSGSLAASWPFLALLAFFLVGNELFKKHYQRLPFQVGVLFLGIFSFSIFFIPVIWGRMGTGVFLLSGAVSVAFLFLFLTFLSLLSPEKIRNHRRSVIATVAGAYAALNALYFANIIPPIPLALSDAGIYHAIKKTPEGGYAILREKKSWFETLKNGGPTLHLPPGGSLVAYTAVFAPTELRATILHEWSSYDAEREAWMPVSRIPFPIYGGRDGGYRGYSVKNQLFPGRWRVNVLTMRGQVVGRITFTIAAASSSPPLIAEIK